eukprot:Hpha_TRINITY_DN16820_c2_g1::TRINITY_DN16820_c2_g1_i1::g.151420::m.151420/K20103/DDX60; ATP-dependent RNA helicase DDX60
MAAAGDVAIVHDKDPETLLLEKVAPGPSAQLVERTVDFVRDTYGRWRPERLNLFVDLVVEEGLVIDADALLIEAFSNYNLAWPKGSGQVLHLIYLCEQVISEFRLRGGKGSQITVVWFDSGRALYVRDSSKLLARECFLRHLIATASAKTHTFRRFPSWWHPSWRACLDEIKPACVLLNDAEQVADVLSISDGGAADAAHAETYVRGLMLDVVCQHYHVVYNSRVVRKDNFMHGFTIRSVSNRFGPIMGVMDRMRECVALLFDPANVKSEFSSSLLRAESEGFPQPGRFDGPAPPTVIDIAGQPLRTRVGATAAAAVLKKGFKEDHGIPVARVWLLHCYLLPEMPVHWRAQELTELLQDEDDRSPYYAAADAFATACLDVAAVVVSNLPTEDQERLKAESATGEYADLWDCRFLRKLVGLLLQNDGAARLSAERAKGYADVLKAAGVAGDHTAILPAAGGEVPAKARDGFTKYGGDHAVPLENPNSYLPTGDALVKAVAPEGEDDPEKEEVEQTLRKIDDIQAWLERSERWRLKDTEEAMLATDDIFENFKGQTDHGYSTSGMTKQNAVRAERWWAAENVKFLRAIEWGAQSMGGLQIEKKSFIPVEKGQKGGATKEEGGEEEGEKDKSPPRAAERKGGYKGGGKKDKGGESTADRIRAEQSKKLEAEKRQKLERAWSNFYSRVDQSNSVERLERAAADIEGFIKDTIPTHKVDDNEVLVKARVQRIKILERAWILETATAQQLQRKPHWPRAVTLFRAVHELFTMYEVEGKKLQAKVKAFQKAAEEAEEKEKEDKKKDKGKKKKDAAPMQTELAPVYSPLFGEAEMQALRHVLVMLGLSDNCKRVDKDLAKVDEIPYDKESKHKLPSVRAEAKHARIVGKDVMMLGHPESTSRFQLLHMGHLLDRPTGRKDDRVLFKPDNWQRELLDHVDRGDSVLCTAPTSAGKTFISYYCMERILSTSNEDVVVYVAPTRALVNQVCCDVHMRYSKTYRTPGWSTFGVLGGGRMVWPTPPLGGPFAAQILITVPSVFETILMSPRYQQWSQRIKCIIFDEVHSIDHGGEGHLWERLLMVTNCQFVALSATIGNAGNFKDWLGRTRSVMGAKHNVQGVYYDHRWNDLQKYVYAPRTKEDKEKTPVRTLPGPDFGKSNLLELHPFSCVKLGALEAYDGGKKKKDDKEGKEAEKGTNPLYSLPLVPRESLELFDVMRQSYLKLWKDKENRQVLEKYAGEDVGDVAKHPFLDPDKYFDRNRTIKQDDARSYERELKDVMIDWVQKGKSKEKGGRGHTPLLLLAKEVLDRLQQGDDEDSLRHACVVAEERAAKEGDSVDTVEYVQKNMLDLLVTLSAQDRLPAIVFNFDQSVCEDLAKTIVDELDQAEAEYRKSPEWKKKVAAQESSIKHAKQQAKIAESAAKASTKKASSKGGGDDGGEGKDDRRREKGGRDDDALAKHAFGDSPGVMAFNDEIPEFTFVRRERGEAISQVEYDSMLQESGLLKKYDADSPLLRCLARGVGVHHNGLGPKYRQMVEKLFRMKHLKVVISTETLALGIHSPCRTVVIGGDDVRLATMQFRQMAGRAGRRGLDWVGNVVFLGVPQAKVERLMIGALPTLKGHHPLDPTAVLRLSITHNNQYPNRGKERFEVDKDMVKQMGKNITTNPLFALGKDVADDLFTETLRMQFRATQEYLQREGFLDQQGKGMYLSGLATRPLYSDHEVHSTPANLVFSALIKRGVFHDKRVCGEFTRKHPQRFTSELLQVLAWFFTRNRFGWKEEIHRSHVHDPDVKDEDCPHIVHLTPLDELFGGKVSAALDKHNEEALRVYGKFARRAAEAIEAKFGKQTQLPASGIDFKGKVTAEDADEFLQELHKESLPFIARSPFVALAGLDDDFHCVEDLVLSVRDHLLIEEDSIPILDFIDLGRRSGQRDRRVHMNAIAFDFRSTGHQNSADSSEARREFLEMYNGLSQSNSWHLLDRFMRVTDNLASMLEVLAPAWKDKDTEFRCSNPLCPPETCRFKSDKGLYKCHTCELDGHDSWQCPTCYANVEDCVVINPETGTSERRREHVYYRHVHDLFVQCLAGLVGELEHLGHELRKTEKHIKRKKLQHHTEKKPKRPLLTKIVRRPGTKLIFKRRR